VAKAGIPNPLDRRHLLERRLSPEQAIGYAELYLAEGRSAEAVDFLVKAGADDRLDALAEEAIAAGDAFLLRLIFGARGLEAGPERWHRLAVAAEERGLDAHAQAARRQATAADA